jgi:hypothetical protein
LQHAITRNKLDYMKTDWALMEDLWEWMFEEDLGVEAVRTDDDDGLFCDAISYQTRSFCQDMLGTNIRRKG